MSGPTDLPLATVLAPNPSVFTGKGTQTYIVGGGDRVVVIDPASDDAGHLDQVAAEAQGLGRPAAIVLTHHHPDHTDGALALAQRLGVQLMARPHRLAPRLDRSLAGGDVLDVGAGSLEVVETPGHASDHICLLWQPHRLVFAGDLVAGEGYIVIDPPDGDMRAYLDSLARIRDLDPARVLPAHGPTIADPRTYLDGYIAHRLEREAKVLGALPPGATRSLEEILPVAYDDTPVAMQSVAARSLLAHLEKLVGDGKVAAEGPEEGRTYRRL